MPRGRKKIVNQEDVVEEVNVVDEAIVVEEQENKGPVIARGWCTKCQHGHDLVDGKCTRR